MHSTVAVEVRAPAALVLELARDIERWPALLPHYVRATVLARHAESEWSVRGVLNGDETLLASDLDLEQAIGAEEALGVDGHVGCGEAAQQFCAVEVAEAEEEKK